jgi:HPt (histidine-containing phosphotransfer) domain-containing protein
MDTGDGIEQVTDGAGPDEASAIGAIDFNDAIKRLGGDRTLYAKVVDSFLVEHSRLSLQLNDQVAKRSYSEAIQTAHTLKGGCGTIGAYAAQKIAAGLQMELGNGLSDRLSDLMERFKHEFTLVISDAKQWEAREKQTS